MCVFPKALKASYLEMSLAGLNSNQSGPLADLKKKKKERWEGVLECRSQLHAGFSSSGCLSLSEIQLLP